MRKSLTLFAIFALLITNSGFAQKTWTGASSTAWNNANNWSPAGIPIASDNVIIPSAPANQPYIGATITPVCNNLTVNAGASLWIASSTTNNAMLTVNGTATFNGSLTIQGYISLTGKIVANNVVWNSGSGITTYAGARMEVSGNWTFASGSTIDMNLCSVTFTGSGTSSITNNSAGSKFVSLTVAKASGGDVRVLSSSTSQFTTTTLSIQPGTYFYGLANINYIILGNIVNSGQFTFSGTARFERTSGSQQIQSSATSSFNNLTIAAGSTITVQLVNNLRVNGNMTIQSGIFDLNENTMTVYGNWINTVGPANFLEGSTTGRVIFTTQINKGEKSNHNFCNYTEHFNILEVDNYSGGYFTVNSALAVVSCNKYDYTTGGVSVQAGTFTANDLVDTGIFGYWGLQTGGTINLTKVSGWVDLNNANLNISGGIFNVYGGTLDSYWPYGGASSITMSGGVLNFAQTGIRVQSSPALTYNITGGTIKTAGSFSSYKSDFNPTGGTVELYGPTDANLYLIVGSTLSSVTINKGASSKEPGGELPGIVRVDRETGKPIEDESTRAQTVNLTNPATFNGNFFLSAGTFNSNSHTIQAKGNWTNNAGAGSFVPGTGRVIFNGGNYHQFCYNETFNILELDKVSGGAFRLASGTSVTCAVYDWTAGSIDVLTNGGTFTALDLFDNGIFGGYFVNFGGTINLYQDAGQWIDLSGNINFTGGGTINIYGGSSTSYWPYNNNASITMNGGVLDFKNHGVFVTTSAHTLATNITGGTIRTAGTFACNRPDFNPTGGTIELYGTQNANLTMSAGTLYNLNINKAVASSVSLANNATLTGGLTVNSGTLNLNAKTLTTGKESAVNNGGVLHLNAGSTLLIQGSYWLNVHSGGLLKAIGTAGNPALISRNGPSYYIYININSGGNISARNARFHYLNPLRIMDGAIIDPDNPLSDCQFRYSATGMLWVENTQTLLIRNTEFLTPATGYNVYKSANSGFLTFKDAFGNYSGAANENDPFNRIHWTTTQPGLWTGLVSSDWHTAGNWDDLSVPTASTHVTIPASAPYMPVISATANCNDLFMHGTLSISGSNILNINGSAEIYGQFVSNGMNSQINITGDIEWHEGSSANTTMNIAIYGNWSFFEDSQANFPFGLVRFSGSQNRYILSNSHLSGFNNVWINKSAGTQVTVLSASNNTLNINGNLEIFGGNTYFSLANITTRLKGNLMNAGIFIFNGTASMEKTSGTQQIQATTNSSFNNLTIAAGVGVNVTLNNHLTVNGNVTIQSGIFNPNEYTVTVYGNWINTAGPANFNEGSTTGKVIFTKQINKGEKSAHNFCNYTEHFNILEVSSYSGGYFTVDNPAAVVSCNQYRWTAGGVKVVQGTFTANDLYQNGLYGNFRIEEGGVMNLTNAAPYTSLDLNGSLYVYGGFLNLTGDSFYVPGTQSAHITMTGGVIDVTSCHITFADGPAAFTYNITGGKFRTARSLLMARPGVDMGNATFEFYGSNNASIYQTAGSIGHVIVDKGAKGDKEGRISEPVPDERDVLLPGNGEKSATLFLATNVSITGNLELLEGTFDLFEYQCNVPTGHVHIYGTLKMNHPANDLSTYILNWKSGSNANVTAGTFHVRSWIFSEGTDAQIGTGNTAYVKILYYPQDDNASFGNLVAVPLSKLSVSDDPAKANYSVKVTGDFTIQSGAEWWFYNPAVDLIVSGSSVIEEGAILDFSQAGFYNAGTLGILGKLKLANGSVAEIEEEVSFPASGWIELDNGNFICNHNKVWTEYTYLNGKLSMNEGSVFQFTNSGVYFWGGFVNEIWGGLLRFGRDLSATFPGNFQLNAGTVEFFTTNTGGSAHTFSGNYFYNMIVNKPSAWVYVDNPLTIKGNLTIKAGTLYSNTETITIHGDWINNVGPSGFNKTTSRVIFAGTADQFCTSENFHILELAKPSGTFYNTPYSTIICDVYDWTSGALWISPGNFTAHDLADDGLYGSFTIWNGTMNLHQDPLQSVNLMGSILVGDNGVLNVHGGSGESRWGDLGDAQLTMLNGTLDFKNASITILDNDPFEFTGAIGAGTIRTTGGFITSSPGFLPTGGSVELYGNNNAAFRSSNGSGFYNLIINKPADFSSRVLVWDATVRNNLIVNQGLIEVPFGRELEVWNSVEVKNGGWMALSSSTLSMKYLSSVNVFVNGTFSTNGYEGAMCRIKGITPADVFTFSILGGAELQAEYTIFETLPEQGVYIAPGAFINPYYCFRNCEFRNGSPGASTLLTIENAQDVVIENAVFPANTWSGQYNVRKNFNSGSVVFVDAVGNFAGSSFEDDPHNRIHWLAKEEWAEGYVNDLETFCAEAYQTLTVEYFMVEPGGTAHLIAGQSILFLPETHIKSGGYMHARISNQWGFCENLPPMLAVIDPLHETDEVKSITVNENEVLSQNQEFRIYPNPTAGPFTLELMKIEQSSTITIEVYGMLGERILHTRLPAEQYYQFDLSGKQTGMYLIRVMANDKVGIEKLLKK